MPTIITPKNSPSRTELLQGTLDMLILRTLLFGPAHGESNRKTNTTHYGRRAAGGARIAVSGSASHGAQGLDHR